ncbi:MAG TPA: type VII secretion target [Mycobacteriales bacterium]|nr:type VII secretion target [Mycobacteriales bacterium]
MDGPISMAPDAVRQVAASVRPVTDELGALRAEVGQLTMTAAQFGPIAARAGSPQRYNAFVAAMAAALSKATTGTNDLDGRMTAAANLTEATDDQHAQSITRIAAPPDR